MRPLLNFVVLFACVALMHAGKTPPALEGRATYDFLRDAREETRHAFEKLDADREVPRNEIQKQKNRLIAEESPEVQAAYEERKKFDAARNEQADAHILATNEKFEDEVDREFLAKVHAITRDMNLSKDEVCDKLVVLKARSRPGFVGTSLWPYGCKF
ncbi:hypothetical protein M3Y99_01500300 [Aphelenchoides fujianensis]|nr:hypothetical protein M3Y99_01500300 [Aphelenchoides fujianensis]